MAIPRLLLFNASVLSNAYRVSKQNPFLAVMCRSRQVDPLNIAPAETMLRRHSVMPHFSVFRSILEPFLNIKCGILW